MDQHTQQTYRPRIEKLLTELPYEADFAPSSTPGNATVAHGTTGTKSRRRQLAFALTRIDGGYFGRCIRCGHNLPPGLLQRDPAALLCEPCPSPRRRAKSGPPN